MEPHSVDARDESGRARPRAGAVLIALGIACLAWAALHMADASLHGSGRTFESRQSYDAVKERSRSALVSTLARAAAGALLIGVGTRLRSGGPGKGRETS